MLSLTLWLALMASSPAYAESEVDLQPPAAKQVEPPVGQAEQMLKMTKPPAESPKKRKGKPRVSGICRDLKNKPIRSDDPAYNDCLTETAPKTPFSGNDVVPDAHRVLDLHLIDE